MIQTLLYKNLCSELERFSQDTRCIRQIVCYGVGNFATTSTQHYAAPLWQLACVLCLQEELTQRDEKFPPIFYYDPCTTSFEKEFLVQHCDVQVLEENERGKRSVDTVTLFYMPHCPKLLYENVLWSNGWPSERALIIAILGNSLERYANNGSLGETRAPTPCLELLAPLLEKVYIQPLAQDSQESVGNFVGAFNDTVLSYCSNSICKTSWPLQPPEPLSDAQEDNELL